jgi:hypothetical protein
MGIELEMVMGGSVWREGRGFRLAGPRVEVVKDP